MVAVRYALQYATDKPLVGSRLRSSPNGNFRMWSGSLIHMFYFDLFTSAGNVNASQLPLACPQDNVDPSAMSEDCLSMILYVPSTVKTGSDVSTLVFWRKNRVCEVKVTAHVPGAWFYGRRRAAL